MKNPLKSNKKQKTYEMELTEDQVESIVASIGLASQMVDTNDSIDGLFHVFGCFMEKCEINQKWAGKQKGGIGYTSTRTWNTLASKKMELMLTSGNIREVIGQMLGDGVDISSQPPSP